VTNDNQSTSFEDLKDNSCGNKFLEDYYSTNFSALLNENCHIISSNLKYLRCTGYILAGYNTFVISNILLGRVLPVSAVTALSILRSLMSLLNSSDDYLIVLCRII
jgi:hypothetical protein